MPALVVDAIKLDATPVVKPASKALVTKNPASFVELSTQFGVIVESVTAVKVKNVGSAGAVEGGVKVKNLLLPFAAEPILAIKGEPIGFAPAAIVLLTKVADAVKVGTAPIVTEPTVVAVLLEAIEIDLVNDAVDEL